MKHIKKYLHREISNHGLQYLTLLTGCVILLILISLLRGYRSAQYTIIVLGVIFYIAWGITHHSGEKSLKLETVVEYILIGGIVLFLLIALIN